MIKPICAVAAIAGGLFATQAAATNWSYVELGYQDIGFDGPDADASDEGDGISLTGFGTLELLGFGVLGGLEVSNISFDADGGDLLEASLLVGGFKSIGTEKHPTDVFAAVSYEFFDFEDEDSADGFALQVGVRSNMTPNLEVNARTKYFMLDEDLGDEEFSLRVGGTYRITGPFSVNLDYETLQHSDRNTVELSARYSYR